MRDDDVVRVSAKVADEELPIGLRAKLLLAPDLTHERGAAGDKNAGILDRVAVRVVHDTRGPPCWIEVERKQVALLRVVVVTNPDHRRRAMSGKPVRTEGEDLRPWLQPRHAETPVLVRLCR